MSSRSKQKIRNRLYKRVLDKKVTPHEARGALAAAGFPVKGQKAAPAAAKSAPAPRPPARTADTVYKSSGAALTPQQQIYAHHSTPAIREAAFQAAYVRRAS